jgi:hypothetical protein
MLHTVLIVDAAQEHAQMQLLAAVKYDGNPYPTYTDKRLATLLTTGTKASETVAFKVVDAWTMEWTDRTNGKVMGTGTVALSRDGKTMTDANKNFGPDGKQVAASVLVYEKH